MAILEQMKRPLLIHGPSESPIGDLAQLVAQLASVPVLDLTREDASERLVEELRAGAPRVVVAPSSALAVRARRLEALDASTVVAVNPDPDVVAHEAHGCLTGAVSTERVAREVISLWERDALVVAAKDRSYTVEVGAGVIAKRVEELVGESPVALLVTDGNVEPLHAAKVLDPLGRLSARALVHVMAPGEKSKIMRTIVHIWNVALTGGADRSSVFLGLGGGVVTDVAGFAAATWMRGVRWVAIPTSLLGMVDAAVGGKTGVDLRSAKNAVGAFWQPSRVVCDVETLLTEPERGFVGALGEVVKTGLIGDPELVRILEEQGDRVLAREPEVLNAVVRRCVAVKARVVGLDEREGGLRAVLNLGHTVGHALEAHSDYSLRHGEAVSLGLVAACLIGERMGTTPRSLTERVKTLLEGLGLPVELRRDDLAAAAPLVGHDKKRAGSRVKFVFLRGVGDVETLPVELDELRAVVSSLGN